MANELSISMPHPGLTVTATLMSGSAIVVSNIAMTESAVPGDYVGSVPTGTAAGAYRVLAISSGIVVGSGNLVWDGFAEASQERAALAPELLRVNELAKLHGLDPAAPLVVTPTTRAAGSITQTISTVADEVTVTRTA